jgi:hypothetical protein
MLFAVQVMQRTVLAIEKTPPRYDFARCEVTYHGKTVASAHGTELACNAFDDTSYYDNVAGYPRCDFPEGRAVEQPCFDCLCYHAEKTRGSAVVFTQENFYVRAAHCSRGRQAAGTEDLCAACGQCS